MSSRPYAAIMMLNDKIFMMDVMAPLKSDEARSVLEGSYPGYQLLALVPGTHAQHSYIYNDKAGARGSTQNLDPFDMSHASEQSV